MVEKAKNTFKTLSCKVLLTTRIFGQLSTPFFANKLKANHKLIFTEKNILIPSDEEIAKTFKKYFDEIVPNLNVIQNECYIKKTENMEDHIIIK